MTTKRFCNEELGTTELYTEVWLTETVRVKDVDDLLVENHYWRDSDGELWNDFDDPMENVKRAFDAYRTRKGYMSPAEIRNLRESTDFSDSRFADALGLASSIVSEIEQNRRVQDEHQEDLFRSVGNDC
ncbi:MAG TPA: transcriptional regulator [Lactobacillus sp.]|mgnify:FL=1|nr:transcriptional regulator [Lactobacillus sp.]